MNNHISLGIALAYVYIFTLLNDQALQNCQKQEVEALHETWWKL